MRRALVDTGAIFAMVVKPDAHHRTASAFVKKWLAEKSVFVLLDLVFVETMTLMKRRYGAQAALRVGRELRQNPVYLWTAFTPELERETWAVFQKYDDKEWSYTDCALLVLSQQLRIPEVFAFDEHFKQMPGITRLP
ncbi:MAG TPA: PIN domain-containing protein [Anaerolineae bacterium]|nr:PIN domain-containing protein [Anaerolineae bacterium]